MRYIIIRVMVQVPSKTGWNMYHKSDNCGV